MTAPYPPEAPADETSSSKLIRAAIWVAIRGLAPESDAGHWTFGAATPTGAMG